MTISMLDYGAILWSVMMKDKNGNAEVWITSLMSSRKSH